VYKPCITHVVVDALSKLLDIIQLIGVPNQTTDANIFYTKLEWLNDVKYFMRIGQIEGTLYVQQK
jgi:hypothetical protein